MGTYDDITAIPIFRRCIPIFGRLNGENGNMVHKIESVHNIGIQKMKELTIVSLTDKPTPYKPTYNLQAADQPKGVVLLKFYPIW